MSALILTLSDPDATLERVGGKGMSLARLARAGMPVPDGFHVTTEAYRRFVGENGMQRPILQALQGMDAADPQAMEAVSRSIGGFFAEGKIPDDIARAVSAAYAALEPIAVHGRRSVSAAAADPVGGRSPAVSVAVRSSATAEDLPGMSFAGQQETYLNVRGVEAVREAVRKCWASLWTARAIAYRARQGIDPDSAALAVVVQVLVHADAAGILFTANPLNGKRDEIVINASWGLGEAIVGGKVTPDTIVVDKASGKVTGRRNGRKDVMTVRTPGGTREEPVPARLRSRAVLERSQAAELARIGARIEDLYGGPMDIEWAVHEGGISILQARPITALPEPPLRWIPSKRGSILARVSFTEFIPDALSPLFATLALPMASDATAKMQVEALGIRGEPAYYFEVVNGYAYSTIVIRQSFKVALRLMSIIRKIYQHGEARAEEAPAKSRETAEKWRRRDTTAVTATELLFGVRELFGATADCFLVAQSWPIPRASLSEGSFSRFYNVLVRRRDDPAAATFLLGLESLPLRAEKSLYDLSQWAKGQADLAGYLLRTPAEEVGAALQQDPVPAPVSGEFAARFAAHLSAFGHVIYDLDFAKPLPADDPAPLLEAMKAFVAGKGGNPHSRQQAQAERRGRAEQAIVRRLDPLRRKRFLKLLQSAQARAPERENAIADLGMTYPQIRRLLGELGRRLTAGGAIACPQDIYWLEAREVGPLAADLEENKPLSNHGILVETRKTDWRRVRKAAPPKIVLPEKSRFLKLLFREKSEGDILKGLGAGEGIVTAPACVLRGPEDFRKMRSGDVIVAVTTTPAWTPLFSMASAVVTDIGGPLSHSSIVAREYGIPAVMAAGSATRRIRNGQTITVDGTTGTVTLS